ncbi:SLBB domain-containing protein [candidate division WOR-3 bacterium]|nr:SLBB domain-containing protein [candidate division WOR-3 bacterium]
MPSIILIAQMFFLCQLSDDVYLINPETYILHPRDRLQLVISGAQGFVQDLVVNGDGSMIVTVGSPGTIAEPSETPIPGETSMLTSDFATGMPLGVVYAEGKSLKIVEEEVRSLVKRYYTGVQVSLVIVRPRHFIILPTGAVARENLPLEVTPLTRVSHAVGNLILKPTASLMRIELRFLDGSVDTANYIEYLRTGDIQHDPTFREEGVNLYFPEIEKSVEVFGAINPYGTLALSRDYDTLELFQSLSAIHEIYEGETLKDLIEIAGGLLQNADASNITVKRDGMTHRIDGTERENLSSFILQDGDIIMIPEIRNSITVIGGVSNPGDYAYVPMKTAFEYVSIAGGVTDRGMLEKVSVYSYDGTHKGDGINILVERGDIVKVPEVTLKWWQDYSTLVGTLISIASLVILLSK